AVKRPPERFRRDLASLLIDDRAARLGVAKPRTGGFSRTRGAAGINILVRHRHDMVTRRTGTSCVTPSRLNCGKAAFVLRNYFSYRVTTFVLFANAATPSVMSELRSSRAS